MKIIFQEHEQPQGIIIANPKGVLVDNTKLHISTHENTYTIDTGDIAVIEELAENIEKAMDESKNYNIYAYLYNKYIKSDYDITKAMVSIND